MMRGDAAEAEQRAGDGDLLAFGEGEHLSFGAGVCDPVAGEDDGLLCGFDEFDGLFNRGGFGAQHRVRAVGGGGGGFEVERRGCLLRVLRYIHKYRTWTPGFCDLQGFADGGGDVFGAGDEEVVLGGGQGDAGDVDLLKRVAPEDFAADLAGDRHNGNAIEHGGGDAGDEVGGTGAGGGDADADLAGGAGVAVGHVRGALLVAHEDVVDGELAQGVVGGEDGSARVAEDFVHALAGQSGPDDFGSGELGVSIFVCHRSYRPRWL